MNFKKYRPEGKYTSTDKKLSKICKATEAFLHKEGGIWLTMFPNEYLSELAVQIVEFAEDTWFEIGMWKAIENYNQKFFGNPLPLSKPETKSYSDFPFDEYRISHFLWNAMNIMRDDHFSPHHPELLPFAKKLSYFLEKQFDKIPNLSTVKSFLSQPHKTGFEVKRKLVWLGKDSYLFRILCGQYLYQEGAINESFQEQIAYIDDFLCQETTLWSGLGVLDILVETIGLSEAQKEEVKMWYERHLAAYQILDLNKNGIRAKNLLNEQVYDIYNDEPLSVSPFKKDMVVYGSLVPFNKQWYWSGNQRAMGQYQQEIIDEFTKNFYQKSSLIVYRYAPDKAALAREAVKKQHQEFIAYFGRDLVEYETGREAAEAVIKRMKLLREERASPEELQTHIEEFNIRFQPVEELYSEDFLAEEDGIAVFFNEITGEEMISSFYAIKEAFQKKGEGMDLEEIEIIQSIMEDSSVSKEFLLKLVEEYSGASIAAAFYLRKRPKYFLDYLLRRFKGWEYRNRYPNFTILE